MLILTFSLTTHRKKQNTIIKQFKTFKTYLKQCLNNFEFKSTSHSFRSFSVVSEQCNNNIIEHHSLFMSRRPVSVSAGVSPLLVLCLNGGGGGGGGPNNI